MAWYNRNKGLAGAMAGFAAGSIVPGLGNMIGAIAGAFIGPAVISDEVKHDHPDGDVLPSAQPNPVPGAGGGASRPHDADDS